MKQTLLALLAAALLSAPVLAQEEVTCGDYSAMDNAKQMETIAALESLTSEMAEADDLTANAIHEKLTADCKDKVDVLVIDLVKGYKS